MIVIYIDAPSSKNTKRAGYAKGKPFMYTDPRIRKAQTDIERQLIGQDKIHGRVAIDMTFYFSTKRRKDLDNASQLISDSLVHSGVIDDDSYKVVSELHLYYGGLDRDNPRVEVVITKLEESLF